MRFFSGKKTAAERRTRVKQRKAKKAKHGKEGVLHVRKKEPRDGLA